MADIPPRKDRWTKYRCLIGPPWTAADRRVWCAGPDQEAVQYSCLRSFERKRRVRFWSGLLRGADAAAAFRNAIGLRDGAIPELQTRAEFDAYWTTNRVAETAQRWKRSPLTRQCYEAGSATSRAY